jgi:hypothetical protein
LALPRDLLTARPKRLRFLIFNAAGRLVHHARQMHLRVAGAIEKIAVWMQAIRFLAASYLRIPIPLGTVANQK